MEPLRLERGHNKPGSQQNGDGLSKKKPKTFQHWLGFPPAFERHLNAHCRAF
jgi:hypothetical protein